MIVTISQAWTKNRKLPVTPIVILSTLIMSALSSNNVRVFLSGVLIGYVFIHFNFGFTLFWKKLFVEKKTLGLRSHLCLLAIGAILFYPALNLLPANGYEVSGAVRPIGLNVLVGAFLFGIGMTLADSCSSGTLRQLGQFNLRYWWLFLWIVISGTFAAYHLEAWQSLPSWGIFSLATDLSWPIGLAITLTVIALLYALLLKVESHHHNQVTPLFYHQGFLNYHNIHTLFWSALLLALLNFVILLLSGHPWAISWIFPKLGIITIQKLNLPFEWDFWEFSAQNESALLKSFYKDNIMLTNLGFIAGISSYVLTKRLFSERPTKPNSSDERTKASPVLIGLTPILAGCLMGYGAVISYGCNIGGFFSAIISGSLHGWLWFISALLGMAFTLWVKPLVSLSLSNLKP